MRKRRMPEMKENGVNVTPLIDIVMCMIIFFMLAARIGITSGAEAMEIPQTVLGGRLDDIGNTLTLNIRRGERELPAISATVGGVQQDLSLDEEGGLGDTLKLLRLRNPRIEIIIRAERELPYRALEPVLLACAEANIATVHFNTRIAEGEAR
jgi:biopolymer transport protein ExbD